MSDTKELKGLPEFYRAVQNEYWKDNPAEYVRFCRFLGQRILDVKEGKVDEQGYVNEWGNKVPRISGEVM